mmetsp:Transcript_28424/g.75136  ORF Transcript_28424/g.75136 Transcript_28424/m.75136 type:complete len:277 (+) Transcript_28424:491-1321(+)
MSAAVSAACSAKRICVCKRHCALRSSSPGKSNPGCVTYCPIEIAEMATSGAISVARRDTVAASRSVRMLSCARRRSRSSLAYLLSWRTRENCWSARIAAASMSLRSKSSFALMSSWVSSIPPDGDGAACTGVACRVDAPTCATMACCAPAMAISGTAAPTPLFVDGVTTPVAACGSSPAAGGCATPPRPYSSTAPSSSGTKCTFSTPNSWASALRLKLVALAASLMMTSMPPRCAVAIGPVPYASMNDEKSSSERLAYDSSSPRDWRSARSRSGIT